MPDPYETLGVARDADADTIKRAYRRASKGAHPDREGGSHRHQQEVNDAYAVLSDPKRRARFDASGDTSPRGRVTENARAILANEFSKLMDQEFGMNPLSLLATGIESMKSQAFADRQALSQRIRFLEKKARALKGPPEDNFLAPVIDGKLAQQRAALASIDLAIETFGEALSIIQAYSWAVEEDPSAGFAPFLALAQDCARPMFGG